MTKKTSLLPFPFLQPSSSSGADALLLPGGGWWVVWQVRKALPRKKTRGNTGEITKVSEAAGEGG